MGEELTWEKVVDDMLNRAANFRLQGMTDKARTLEEAARGVFERNVSAQIKEKIKAARAALATAEELGEIFFKGLKPPPKPLPSNPVNITELQNKSVMNKKFRLMVKVDPFLIMQLREWMLDYAAYRKGPEFNSQYKSQKEFIDTQWFQYYVTGSSRYEINGGGYRKWKRDSYT